MATGTPPRWSDYTECCYLTGVCQSPLHKVSRISARGGPVEIAPDGTGYVIALHEVAGNAWQCGEPSHNHTEGDSDNLKIRRTVMKRLIRILCVVGIAACVVRRPLPICRSAQHPFHLQRRPRLPGGQRLRLTASIPRRTSTAWPAKECAFDRCLVTNSLCGPSRRHGAHRQVQPRQPLLQQQQAASTAHQVTFPKLLQQAGYQTAIVGKWHLESDPTGFDYWHILPGQGLYYNPPMICNGKRSSTTAT